MTSSATPSRDDDSFWRRPAGTSEPNSRQDVPAPAPAGYAGPPKAGPPPFGWRPPVVVQPSTPRAIPPQEHSAIDDREQTAETITSGVGLIAGAIMLVLVLVLCGRWLF